MGQKVHPIGFRLGYTKDWQSRWYAKRDYADLLHEDIELREMIRRRFHHAGVSRVEIERAANKLKLDIHTARPGIVIGRNGSEVDRLKKDIERKTSREVYVNIQEVNRPELDAQLVAENIALQLQRRVAFRRAMRRAVETSMRFGATGI
jgi:small subunit ribosomal protein S3